MATLYTHQSENVAKTWVFITGFLLLVILLGFVFAQALGNASILYGAVILSLVMNLGSYWYSDKIVLAMVRARRIEKQEDAPELWRIVENLAITAGLPMPKLYIVDDPSPNAFATGRDKEHAAVAVHSGILSILEKRELEGVLAHELSHVGNRDTLVSTIVVVLAGMVSILSDWFLRASLWGGRDRDSRASGIFMLLGLALSILAPIFAMLIQLAVSRKREFLADASGALLTRYPEGLASALEKISGANVPSTTATNALSTLYISEPSRSGPSFFAKLFMTHPPVEERIAALRDMNV
jgi:heat shock protein HtpX